MGTGVGVVVWLLLRGLETSWYLAIVTVLFVGGIWLCGAASRGLRTHDHPAIVWDEIVGYLVTMTAAPAGWPWMLAGFLLFRLFDIAKPWPIGLVDRRVTGGLGIMLDDLLAGIYAFALLQAARAILPGAA